MSELTSACVCLDPGHGGTDRGATHNGVDEADWALACGLAAERVGAATGLPVYLTRVEDRGMSLDDRARRAMSMAAGLTVAIHVNAVAEGMDPSSYRGGLVFHWPGNKNASMVALEIARRMPGALQTVRVIAATEQWTRVREVMRRQPGDSILVEAGYATNAYDAAYLASPWAAPQVAVAIISGALYWAEHYA